MSLKSPPILKKIEGKQEKTVTVVEIEVETMEIVRVSLSWVLITVWLKQAANSSKRKAQ